MQCSRGFLTAVMAAVGVLVAGETAAQGRVMGEVTDPWGNGLLGATVVAEPQGDVIGGPQETETDENGEFLFVGLARGVWDFTVTLDGYQGIRQGSQVSQLNQNRLIEVELPVLPTGGLFRERTDFEADGGTPRFRFEDDGEFEFEDTDGAGEGTYGIVEQSAILVVREYDGPDDKFGLTTPVVVEFGDAMFTSMTYNGVELSQQ